MIIFSISGLIRDYNNNNNIYDKVGRLSVCPSLIKFTLYHYISFLWDLDLNNHNSTEYEIICNISSPHVSNFM